MKHKATIEPGIAFFEVACLDISFERFLTQFKNQKKSIKTE